MYVYVVYVCMVIYVCIYNTYIICMFWYIQRWLSQNRALLNHSKCLVHFSSLILCPFVQRLYCLSFSALIWNVKLIQSWWSPLGVTCFSLTDFATDAHDLHICVSSSQWHFLNMTFLEYVKYLFENNISQYFIKH